MVYTAPRLTTVLIDSTDVAAHLLTWKSDIVYNRFIGEATITLSSTASAVLTLDKTLNGKSVTIQRGVLIGTETYIFRGEVVDIQPYGNRVDIVCKDKYYAAIRTEVTKTYDINIDTEAGVYSEIFTDLITTYSDGLVADSSSVQNSGTLFVTKKFVCNHADVYERCDEIAKTLNWQHYYDPITDKIYFEAKGFVDSGITLTVGEDIVVVPKWKFSSEKLANEVTIIGAEQLISTVEFFNGDASTTEFTLSKTPVDVKIYVGSSNFDPFGTGTRPSNDENNLQIGGKEGSTSGTFDYAYDDDPTIRKIEFESSSIPSSNTSNIEVQYTYKLPSPVMGSDPESITTYTLHQKTVFKPELKAIADAENYLRKYLEHYKDPLTSTTLKVTNATNLQIGRIITVVDSQNNVNEELVITKIAYSYPYKYDTVTVGEEPMMDGEWEIGIMDRVRRQEEKDGESQDLLLHVIEFTNNINLTRESFEKIKYKICDSFIVGHYINGVIEQGIKLDDMEVGSAANWSGSNFTVTDSTDEFISGTHSVKLVWAGGAGTGTLTSTQTFGDISEYTGVSSGRPSKGTVGLWVYVTTATDISTITLKLGSSAVNYTEVDATAYASVNGYSNWGELTMTLQVGWNYLLFDIDAGVETGTPDWSSCDYAVFDIVFAGNSTCYIDYFTISESNFIGLNGIGSRKMVIE